MIIENGEMRMENDPDAEANSQFSNPNSSELRMEK
jgi:hypothetical protein